MLDPKSETANRRSETFVLLDSDAGINRTLVMRPKSFFSNEYQLEFEDAESNGVTVQSELPRLAREDEIYFKPTGFIDLQTLLLIFFVGIPILVYGVLSFPG
ncbi:hypothetical protein OKW76_12255 [Sphingomonas sp. S1-29]|uniref:hypothetical protein n=1 Tax=Sphingomonas sp. S1-29 TaxID=2991074 RepID=UPI00223EB9F2|nr:hypothetical protein [Sphingomonas sp. S1-29]UZK68805.1 hypothetical protein OKW76_12255 [Sphingomonas sp. S1-29]